MIKKILVYSCVLSLFVAPMFAFANHETSTVINSYAGWSEQELLNLIAKLQKQLEEIKNSASQCVVADVDLSIGDGEGDLNKIYVKNLQNFLKEKGYFNLEPTGYFGKITRASLVNFQKDSNLTQNGELDLATRTYIKTLNCKKIYKIETKIENNKEIKPQISTHPVNTQTNHVTSISLTGEGQSVSWSTVGYSKSGFKIVWSKNQNPTYPTRDGDKYIYLSDPNANNTALDAFSGNGTYYVRVCEYTGVCGVYSNEITVSF
jgi:hypothetical protein